MQRVTIIRSDNAVYVDGVARTVDCSTLPTYFHALQWYGSASPPYGVIEFAKDANGVTNPNIRIPDLSPYQYLVDAWHAAAPQEG